MNCDVPAIMMLWPQLECQYRIVPAVACQKLCSPKMNMDHLWHFLGCNANSLWKSRHWVDVTWPQQHYSNLDMCTRKVLTCPFATVDPKNTGKLMILLGTNRSISWGETRKTSRSHVAVASAGDIIKPELSIKSWALAKENVQALRSCSTGSSSDTWECKRFGWVALGFQNYQTNG